MNVRVFVDVCECVCLFVCGYMNGCICLASTSVYVNVGMGMEC